LPGCKGSLSRTVREMVMGEMVERSRGRVWGGDDGRDWKESACTMFVCRA